MIIIVSACVWYVGDDYCLILMYSFQHYQAIGTFNMTSITVSLCSATSLDATFAISHSYLLLSVLIVTLRCNPRCCVQMIMCGQLLCCL